MLKKIKLSDLVALEKYIDGLVKMLSVQLATGVKDKEIAKEGYKAYLTWSAWIEEMKKNHFSARHYDKGMMLLNRLYGVLLLHKETNKLFDT